MLRSKRFAAYQQFFTQQRLPNFRFNQLIDSIFKQKITNFEEMNLLPAKIREELAGQFGPSVIGLSLATLNSSQQVDKAMFAVPGGENIESVLMKFRSGNQSLCISSQSGCALACSFCATGAVGFKKNLSADEIVDQVLYFLCQGEAVDNITFMGMGEPLQNPNCFKALDMLTDPKLFNMSPRRLSISTVGIIPGIRKLTKEYPQVNLAFSLHSPFEEQRNRIVPVNKTHPFPLVLEALDDHIRETGRKIFVAYLVLDGHNDTEEHAKAVADLLTQKRPKDVRHLYHMNLLRMNPISLGEGRVYTKTDEGNMNRFRDSLVQHGLKSITIRHPFGVEMDAACGQLFAQYEAKKVRTFGASGQL